MVGVRWAGAIAIVLISSTLAFVSGTMGRSARAGTDNDRVLNGNYRVTWSEKALIAAGTTRKYAHANYGTVTMRLQDGFYTLTSVAPKRKQSSCKGPYTVTGKSLYIDLRVHNCIGEVKATWTLTNGELRLHVLRATDPGDRVVFGGKPWKKIA